jgi:hypothetical protein
MLTFVKKDFAAFYEKFLNYYRGAGAAKLIWEFPMVPSPLVGEG